VPLCAQFTLSVFQLRELLCQGVLREANLSNDTEGALRKSFTPYDDTVAILVMRSVIVTTE
jgi:hypothetical protein